MSHKKTQSAKEETLWSDFLEAIKKGNENQVRRILLETDGRFLTRKIGRSGSQETVLHLAVRQGTESIVSLLLESGINIHAVDHPHSCTALHIAVQGDNVGIIQLLLNQKDINVNAADGYGNTPIKLAAEKGNKEAVKLLIDKGAHIINADVVENTAIHVAAENGHYEVLHLLLKTVQNTGLIGQQNKDQNTPLHLAVKKQCQKTVAILLHYHAAVSMEVRNRHNETPKQLASGNKEITELLENPSKVSQQVQELFRPVVKTIGRGGSVEADNGHHFVEEPTLQVSCNDPSLLADLPGIQGSVPLVVHVKYEKHIYNTDVHNGGCAAIGPGSQVNKGDYAVTSAVHPQLPAAAESSYNINQSGGNASIGDHSITNVSTATPRTPSTAGSIEDPFTFLEHPENRDTRSSGSPTENQSVKALRHPVLEETGENGSDTPGKLPYAVPEVGSAGSPTEKTITGNSGALAYPVPEGNTCNSGTPTESENGSDTPGKSPYAVSEVGSAGSPAEKTSVTSTTGALAYPVPERNSSGTPTENASDADAPGKLPYPVHEENHTQKAEGQVTTLSSARDDKSLGEAACVNSSNSDRVVTDTTRPSKGTERGRTVAVGGTTATRAAASSSSGSSEKTIATSGDAEASKHVKGSGASRNTRAVGTVLKNELKRSTISPENTRNVQAIGASGDVRVSKASTVDAVLPKNNSGWGSAVQKDRQIEGSRGVGALSRAVPKDVSKRLLQMTNSPAGDPTISDLLQSQRPDFDPASEVSAQNRQLPESQTLSARTESKSQGVEFKSAAGAVKLEEKPGDERGGGLIRVGLFGSPGPPLLLSAGQTSATSSDADASGNGLENATTSRLSSSCKDASHKKERFLRGDSSPDGDFTENQGQIPMADLNTSRRTALAAQHESVSSAGVSSENRSEHETVLREGVNWETIIVMEDDDALQIQNDNPEDDSGGRKRCDSNCPIM